MDSYGGGGQIPRLRKNEIAKRAEELLDECWDGTFPIGVESICDYLDISIVPIKRLKERFHIDAYISSDFKTIYVDEVGFKNESYRYRFSVAHELGHLILHRDYFSRRVEDFEEWVGFSQGVADGYIEYQANYFAASLLMPERKLVDALDAEFDGDFVRRCWNKNHDEFKNVLYRVQRLFKVSEQVLARRMRDEFLGAESFDEVRAVLEKV